MQAYENLHMSVLDLSRQPWILSGIQQPLILALPMKNDWQTGRLNNDLDKKTTMKGNQDEET